MKGVRVVGRPPLVLRIGDRYGRLIVSDWSELRSGGHVQWKARCDCGNDTFVTASNLLNGRVQSCGCYEKESRGRATLTHGKSRSPVYSRWAGMINRCENINHKHYRHYGGRGIVVCERWRVFANFFADMGDPPSTTHTIDRIDNNGPYSPDNCRWATSAEQATNKRTNRTITVDDTTMTVTEWAHKTGIPVNTLFMRLRRGTPIQQLLEPVSLFKNHRITVDSETRTLAEWGNCLGLKPGTVLSRLKRGWSAEEACRTQKGVRLKKYE